MKKLAITFSDIEQARERIRSLIIKTPCTYSSFLSEMTGANVYLKLENLQLTGAYKVRGAFNRIGLLSEEEKKCGVIAASAGNHAQGVAKAAKEEGITATIVMPTNTPLSKIDGTKKLGAEVVLVGSSYDEAYEYSIKLQKEIGATFIHPFNDPDIIAGQGTVGIEIFEKLPEIDIMVVPIGGGGLSSGIAVALKHLKPSIQMIGVEAENMPAMKVSCEKGEITEIPRIKTIAEGIAVCKVKENTFNIIDKLFDQIVTVSESGISRSIVELLETEKTLSEGAGAVGVAALLEERIEDIKDKNICIVVSGGNVDLNFLERLIKRGLHEDGRVTKVKLVAHDTPGVMADICNIISDLEANILEIFHQRSFSDTNLGHTMIELILETKGLAHSAYVIDTLKEKYEIRS